MVHVIELFQPTRMVKKTALHLERFFNPGKLHPLELGIAFAKVFPKAGLKILIGTAHIGNIGSAARELKNAENALGHPGHIFRSKFCPWTHATKLYRIIKDSKRISADSRFRP